MKALKIAAKIAAVLLGTVPALLCVWYVAIRCVGVSPNWVTCAVLALAGLVAAFYPFDFTKPSFVKKFALGVVIGLLIIWALIALCCPRYTYDAGLLAVTEDAQYAGYRIEACDEKSTAGLLKPKPGYFITSYYLYRAQAQDGSECCLVFNPVNGQSGFCDNEIITALAAH